MFHGTETIGGIHVPYNWLYADATARTGATGFLAADIGKLARQADDNSLWMLTAVTPTWSAIGSSGGVTADNVIAANSLVIGNAGDRGVKAVAGLTTDGISRLQLGVIGGAVGGVEFRNATTGTVSLVPVTGALGTSILLLPAQSGTILTTAALGTGVATFLATPSSANLATAVTDETGTGSLVFATSPVFATDITLPNAAGPTTGAVAKTAFNTTAWAASRGAIQIHDGTANTYVVAVLASDTPSNGQVPTWNTGGTITWETPTGGGGTPGGSNTQLQYNNSSAFGGISGATTDGTSVTFGSANLLATRPKITTSLDDSSGNELFKFTATASAVNELTLANAAAAGLPTLSATGNDTDISIRLQPKGAGVIQAYSTGSGPILQLARSSGTYAYSLGVDSSNHFNVYDNDGSTVRLSVKTTTGQVVATNNLNAASIYAGYSTDAESLTPWSQFGGDTTAPATILYKFNASPGPIIYFRGGRGTRASPTAIQSGDSVGDMLFTGATSTTLVSLANTFWFHVIATENYSGTNQGTAVTWWTCLTGAASLAERVRLSGGGNWLIGTTADTGLTGAGGLSVASATEATSSTAGAAIVTGGLAIAKKIITGSSITTGTPNGGTAGAWKFGIRVAATVVLDTTQYIQLDVGGTLYQVALAV